MRTWAAADAGYTTSPDGTGVGLSIVERAVEAHARAVDVVPSESGGTRFDVTGVDRVGG